MLLQLKIENFATISELEVEFTRGFSILTGETGAGKSIMIDAILLVLGHRGDPGMIRTGKELAEVEGIFSVPENPVNGEQFNIRKELELTGINLDDELIVRCIVSRKGRQKRYINGVSVTADFLKSIGRKLINIHGQHDNQSLLQVSSHLDFLDGFGQLIPLRQQVTEAFQALHAAKKEQLSLQKRFADRAVRIDELKEIIADLNELNFQTTEGNDLRKEENRLTHVEKLLVLLGQVLSRLNEADGSVIEQLELSRKLLGEAEQIDSECSKTLSGIETALFQVEDSYQELVQYSDKVEDDPERLALINERLSRIQHYTRKYRLDNPDELLTLFEDSKQELDSLEHLDENEQEICEKIEQLRNQTQKFAELLSRKRHDAAKKMATFVGGEIHVATSAFFALPDETRFRILAHSLTWLASAQNRPRQKALLQVMDAIGLGKIATLHGCIVYPRNEHFVIAREPSALDVCDTNPEMHFDGRWRLEGPIKQGQTLSCLGESGLAACRDWRESGMSRFGAMASPAIWENAQLIAAPMVLHCPEWQLIALKDDENYFSTLLGH